MEQIASPYVLNLIREATDLIDVDINESLLKFLEGLQNLRRILGKGRKLLQSQKKSGSIIFPKYLTQN